MARRAHLLDPDRGTGRFTDGRSFEVSWCGRIEEAGRMPIVDDPALADCLRCLDALERDANPPDVPSYLRQRAYSRALSLLRDRYRDEFDVLLDEALVDVVAEERSTGHAHLLTEPERTTLRP